MNAPTPDEILDTPALLARWSISERKLYDLRQLFFKSGGKRGLPCVRIGGGWFYKWSDVLAFFDAHKVKA